MKNTKKTTASPFGSIFAKKMNMTFDNFINKYDNEPLFKIYIDAMIDAMIEKAKVSNPDLYNRLPDEYKVKYNLVD